MGWDKKHYRAVRAFVEGQVCRRPWCYKKDFESWLQLWISMIADCVDRQDYEGAQATKDAITQFLNKYLPFDDQIPRDAIIRLPELPKINR